MRIMYIMQSHSETMPSREFMEAAHKLAERETKAGRMLDTAGLLPSTFGKRVHLESGTLSVTDGPFTETKEIIGGYAVFELPGMDEALAMAQEFMQLHRDLLPGWSGVCEIRPFASPGAQA